MTAAAPPPILGVIAETTELARQLLAALKQEAVALAAMRLKAPAGFAEAKTRLTSAYAYKLEELREAPMVPEAGPALDALRALNDELMAAARHNAAMLEGAMAANRRLIDLVVQAAAQHAAPAGGGYGRIGNRPAPAKPTDRAVSVMLTRKL